MNVQILHRFQDPEAERLVISESVREHVSQLTGTEACDKKQKQKNNTARLICVSLKYRGSNQQEQVQMCLLFPDPRVGKPKEIS